MAGEGEGEAQRQRRSTHAHVLQKGSHAVNDVVKKLPMRQSDISKLPDITLKWTVFYQLLLLYINCSKKKGEEEDTSSSHFVCDSLVVLPCSSALTPEGA